MSRAQTPDSRQAAPERTYRDLWAHLPTERIGSSAHVTDHDLTTFSQASTFTFPAEWQEFLKHFGSGVLRVGPNGAALASLYPAMTIPTSECVPLIQDVSRLRLEGAYCVGAAYEDLKQRHGSGAPIFSTKAETIAFFDQPAWNLIPFIDLPTATACYLRNPLAGGKPTVCLAIRNTPLIVEMHEDFADLLACLLITDPDRLSGPEQSVRARKIRTAFAAAKADGEQPRTHL